MAAALRSWIALWFCVSTLVVAWDTAYIMLRPRSMPGGSLHWLWAPYSAYVGVDYTYGFPSVRDHDGFPRAQSTMNVAESILNWTYVYYAWVSSSPRRVPRAQVAGLVAAALTAAKTVLYILNDAFCGPHGWCKTGHNDLSTWITLWVLPNTPWVVAPTVIAVLLARDILRQLPPAPRLKQQ